MWFLCCWSFGTDTAVCCVQSPVKSTFRPLLVRRGGTVQGTARRIAEAVEEIPKCVAHYTESREHEQATSLLTACLGLCRRSRMPHGALQRVRACWAPAGSGSLEAGSKLCSRSSMRQAGKCHLDRRAGRVGLGSKVLVCCRIRSAPSALGSGFPGLLLGPTVFGLRTLVGWWEQRSLACRLLGAPCVGPGDHVRPRKLSSAGRREECSAVDYVLLGHVAI